MRPYLIALLSIVAMHAGAQSKFQFSEPRGQFAVGFKIVQQYDVTRTFLGRFDPVTGEPTTVERGRPMQTLIWYPCSTSNAPMHYGDYVELSGSEDRFDRSAEQIRAVSEFRLRDYVPAEMSAATVKEIMSQPMWATRGAAPALAGKFPVVIYAPSHNASAYENADLCEYLASHGYIVIATASMGADDRWMNQDLADIETQVADIEFLVGYAAHLTNVDSTRIAVIGYSWGGIANVFAAAKDSRISALVGFDGGIRLVGKLVSAAKYVTPERITVPFLYLSAAGSFEDLYRQKQDLSDDLLARLKYSDLYIVTFSALVHYHFASAHLRFLSMQDRSMFPGDYSLDEIFRAYGWLARYTVAFLDGEFKKDAQGLAFIANAPVVNGLPAHEIKIEVERSTGLPPTREALAAEINRKGFDHADEIYQSMRKRNPDFKLPPYQFINWIDELLLLHKSAEAIQISRVFAEAYPDRPVPYTELGESYLAHGDRVLAIVNFRKALVIAPSDDQIRKRLADAQSARSH